MLIASRKGAGARAWHTRPINGGWVGPVDASVPGYWAWAPNMSAMGVSVAAQSHLAGSEEHGLQWSQVALECGVGKHGWSGHLSWASRWTEGSGVSPLPVSYSQVSQAWGLRSSPPRPPRPWS